MRTITAVPVIALVGGLAAGAAHADDAAPSAAQAAAQAVAPPVAPAMAPAPAPVPAPAPAPAMVPAVPQAVNPAAGNIWGVRSAAEREARAIVDSERAASSTAIPQAQLRGSRGSRGAADGRADDGRADDGRADDGRSGHWGPADGRAVHGRPDVEQLALSTLARHAARAMGQDNARVLGLDAIAPTVDPAVASAEARSPASTAPRARTVAFRPDAMREGMREGMRDGGMAGEVVTAERGATRPRHTQLALAPPNARLASAYDDLIEEVARRHDVAPHLVRAVIKVESNFQPQARSPKGAVGLMQVMPATGRRFGAADLRDPRSNLSAGTQYLRWLLNRFDEDLTLALAAYNAGEGAVERYGRRIPPFAETQGYVGKVLAHLGLTPGTAQMPLPAAPTAGANAPGNGGTADAQAAGTIASRTGDGSSAKAGRPARAGSNAAARQQADATLRTVSNWIGALLTSSSQPPTRAATNGTAATVRAMATDAPVEASTWTRLPAPEPVRAGPV